MEKGSGHRIMPHMRDSTKPGQPGAVPSPHPGTALTFTTTWLLLSLMVSLKLLDRPEEKAISLN